MTSGRALQGSLEDGAREPGALLVLLVSFMKVSATMSRLSFFGGLFFAFITTTRLELPVFFSFDKFFLVLSLVFWLTSPAPLTGICGGSFILRTFSIRREQWPVVAMFLIFLLLKLFDMQQRISHGNLSFFGLFGYLVQEAPYALLPLMLCIHVKSDKELEFSIRIVIGSIALSSLVALGIYFDVSDVFLRLRDALVPPNSMFPEMGRLHFHSFQSGLSASAYIFSYQISLAIPIAFFSILGARTLFSKAFSTFLLLFFLMTLGVIGTRMPIISCLAGILYGYNKIAKIKWKHLLGVLGAGGVVVVFFAIGGLAIQKRFQSENLTLDFLDKFWAQIAAFVSLPSHPWGVGYGNVESNDYVNALNADIRLVHLPHFHFITSILFWGFPGLILSLAYCWTLWSVLRITASPERIATLDPSRKIIAASGVGALVSSIINGMAHNPGPFFSDYTCWLALGWIVAAISDGNREAVVA